jgi:hypothetical protein
MSQPEPSFVVYVDVAADESAAETQLRAETERLPEVDFVDVRVEEQARSGTVEAINSITLTITALGGTAGATAALLEGMRRVLKGVHGVRAAWVGTAKGPVPIDEAVPEDQGPTYEKPAQ